MSSNQLDMFQLIKIKSKNNGIAREARRKFFTRGGTKLLMGGDSKFFGWGGTGFDGGGLPLNGGGPPPSPPILASPGGGVGGWGGGAGFCKIKAYSAHQA